MNCLTRKTALLLLRLLKRCYIHKRVLHKETLEMVGKCVVKKVITFVLLNTLTSYVSGRPKNESMYYILLATKLHAPFQHIELEQKPFIDRNCAYQNCFFTEEHNYLDDVTDFDVVLFNPVGIRRGEVQRPEKRSNRQKYVFYSLEAAANYPFTSEYNDFFNWTWTYKFDSDLVCPYIAVRNDYGELIGPKPEMNWKAPRAMKSTSKSIVRKFRKKKIAAAWFVSHCDAISNRAQYVKELKKELAKYEHTIDIYGWCGNMSCNEDECFASIENYYYFYLSFENSFCADYVTEKVLHAVEHFAVPIVMGGANYTRFLPDGSYLDVKHYNPSQLAVKMATIIRNKQRYYDYFKWRRYYSLHDINEVPETDIICSMCAYLNTNFKLNTTSVYSDIVRWFNDPKDWPKEPTANEPEEPNVLVKFFMDLLEYYKQ